MESTATHPRESRQKELHWRLFWFVVGAGVNYLLISSPLGWLKTHTQFPIWAIVACSLATSTTLLFVWNYFVNFRSSLRKREALPRYLAAVGFMYVLQWITLTLMKHHNGHLALNLFGHPLDLDILGSQALLAGVKFPLYHKWAFPVPKGDASA